MANQTNSQTLIDALRNPALYPHKAHSVHVLETHISWVLLADRYAYKIKKPVNLGFLDFTELGKRHFYCREEIRLNRRLAPQIYLDVISIGGSPQQPVFLAEPAFEYAVRMRRFPAGKLLVTLLEKNQLSCQHIDKLAATLSGFHAQLPHAGTDGEYGSPQAIAAPMRDNFRQVAKLLSPAEAEAFKLTELQTLSEQMFSDCLPLFNQRREAGFIRECHGDLHLGNIVLLQDTPTPFDGIEFDAKLRWIDVMNDVAFLLMDLQFHRRPDLAYRFLNAYLDISGDHAGLGVLQFYIGYRAMVRAKIAAIRFAQTQNSLDKNECCHYLALTGDCLAKRCPVLIITHGLPGSGKTTFSQMLLEKWQIIRIRSDIERKRLFGLTALETSGSGLNNGIYAPQASEQTYWHLLALARMLLMQGFKVVIDAAFLKHRQRQAFRELGRELAIPFVIVSIQCDADLLRQRIRQRRQLGQDASEADLAVLAQAEASAEALQGDELGNHLIFINNENFQDDCDKQAFWQKLDRFLTD